MRQFLKIAVLSAAIALATSATSAVNAQENIVPPVGDVTQPTTGSGSLLFYAWDSIAGTSLSVNLGLSLDTFLPAAGSPDAGRSISFGVLSGFSTAFAAGTSNLRWAVAAGDSTDDGSGTALGRRLATTALAAPTLATRNSAMSNAINNLNDFSVRLNDDVNCASGTPCVAPAGNGAYAFQLENSIDGLIGGAAALNFQNTGTISQALEFFLFSGGGIGGTTNNTTRVRYENSLLQAGLFSLSTNGVLTWNSPGGPSVVPLPAAAWLLFSGLAGLGVVARRRRSPEAASPVMA